MEVLIAVSVTVHYDNGVALNRIKTAFYASSGSGVQARSEFQFSCIVLHLRGTCIDPANAMSIIKSVKAARSRALTGHALSKSLVT